MSRKATSVADVLLGEAVTGTLQERFDDMVSIASVIANRAMQTGTSLKSIVSAPGQFGAFGKGLPKGAEAHRNLAEAALAHVERHGPVHNATYYATPSARNNLPSGLQNVHATTGHVFATDPQNRSIRTADGYKAPTATIAAASAPVSAPMPAPAPRGQDAVGYAPQTPQAPALQAIEAAIAPTVATTAPAATEGYVSPLGVFGDRVVSDFGHRSAPATAGGRRGSSNHKGIDLTAAHGKHQTGVPVAAVAPGVVSFAGKMAGYGNLVEITHDDGKKSRYGHLGDTNPASAKFGPAITVQEGQRVSAGTPIGILGNTGNVSGPHLHFEMIDEYGRPMNPAAVVEFAAQRDVPTPTAAPRATQLAGNLLGLEPNIAPTTAVPGIAPSFQPAPTSIGLGKPGEVAGVPAHSVQTTSVAPNLSVASLPSTVEAPQMAGLPGRHDAAQFASAPVAPPVDAPAMAINDRIEAAHVASSQPMSPRETEIATALQDYAVTPAMAASLNSQAVAPSVAQSVTPAVASAVTPSATPAVAPAATPAVSFASAAAPVTAVQTLDEMAAVPAANVAETTSTMAKDAVAPSVTAQAYSQLAESMAKAGLGSTAGLAGKTQAQQALTDAHSYAGKTKGLAPSNPVAAPLAEVAESHSKALSSVPSAPAAPSATKSQPSSAAKSSVQAPDALGQNQATKAPQSDSLFGSFDWSNPNTKNSVIEGLGTAGGMILGSLFGGPIGGTVGSILGKNLAMNAFGVPVAPTMTLQDFHRSMASYQSGLGFPDAPAATGQEWGGWSEGTGFGSHAYAEGVSPAATAAIDAGKAGLY
jgi:murein DD-endopeptidase MepM/ murein hydrolase activator NlpD